MSLLMQALKKAERAKQNSLHEEEIEKPSEAFDDFLALTPQDVVPPGTPPAASGPELSLSPLDAAPGRTSAAPPAPPAQPAAPPLSLADYDQEAIPALIPATEAIHDPTPPQSRIEPALKTQPSAQSAAAAGAETSPAAGHDAASIGGGPAAAGTAASSAGPAAARPAEPRTESHESRARPGARADARSGARADAPSAAQPAPSAGAAARARAAARAAPADKTGWDPARIRIAVLSAIMLLILAVFGYIYWQATSAPGAGARLPMVPMPPPNAGNATPAIIVEAQPGPDAAATPGQPPAQPAFSPPAAASPPFPSAAEPAQPRSTAPGAGARMPSEEDIQRQLEQAAQEQQAPRPAAAAQPRQAPPEQTAQQQSARAAPSGNAAPAAIGAKDIQIRRTAVAPTISPPLHNGYQAYLAGDLAAAARHYDNALRQDPNNRDALLGAAAVAVRNRQGPQAASAYLRLLELDPNDADALAGLIGLRPGDSGHSEMRLKAILQKTPDAGPVLFALGNLYARQGRWPEAQQTYFRAYTASPDNADYAFNLAIGLDRLNQGKLALDYYQRALTLAGGGFDRNAAQARVQALAAASTGAGPN